MYELDPILDRLRANDNRAIDDLLREMASFIYRFPKIRRKDDIVESGEFYEYAYSKLSDGSRLRSFDIFKGSFIVWFTKVLDNFLNTLVNQKIRESRRIETIDIETDALEAGAPSAIEIITFSEERKSIERIFSTLNDTEKAVAICHTLFYRDLGSAELTFLSDFTKKDAGAVCAEIEGLLEGELLDEEARIRKESEKIGALYRSLQRLESKLSSYQSLLENNPSNEEITNLIEKLEFGIWKKRTKYIQLSLIHRRGKGLVLLKNWRIAEFLNLKEGTVSSAVTRLRQKFNQQLN